ncbi:mandelate racemase/muconate lactonizing enzyme family protein [Microbacterium sp. NPDC007973]|uniref:mandelate racemase/muconate lactonizing enzyme family protein n=1 Tax=Microbacterium sp. NPDC007973 TaxID=3364182 RepID=UPI0036E3119C
MTSVLAPGLHDAHTTARVDRLSWATAGLPLAHELHHARARTAALDAVVCRIEIEGVTGIAEVRGNAAYGTGENTADVVSALSLARATGTVGERHASLSRRSRLAALALDLAAWDARARAAGLPLAVFLSGPVRGSIDTHGQIPFGTVADAEARASALTSDGLGRLKIRVGGPDVALDVARVRAARSVAGEAVDISVDANGAWDAEHAIDASRALASLGVVWVEQPTPDLEGLSAVRADGAVRVRADEATHDVEDLRLLGGVVDGVHLKLEKSGSFAALDAAVAAAEDVGLDVAVGQFDQGRLGCAATLHCAVALGFTTAEVWGFADVSRDIAGVLERRGPGVPLPSGPGLGVDLLTPLDWTSAR